MICAFCAGWNFCMAVSSFRNGDDGWGWAFTIAASFSLASAFLIHHMKEHRHD